MLTADAELQELNAVYQPVLWMPDKRDMLEQAWQLHVAALGEAAPERTDEEAKKAQVERSTAAVQVRATVSV